MTTELRQRAAERFEALGMPTTRLEDWKYTNVAPIAKLPLNPGPDTRLSAEQLASLSFFRSRSRLVFVNGRLAPEHSSLPEGVRVGRGEQLAQFADYQQQAFVALNTARFADGAFLEIPRGKALSEPINLLFVSTSGVSHPRVLVTAGAGSEFAIVEDYVTLGGGGHFTNAVTEIAVGDHAVVEHYRLQRESAEAFHVSTVQVRQGRAANYLAHTITLGGRLVRNDLNTVLDGEGAEATLNGLYVTGGSQHVDNHTLLDHAKPHCASREFYKGILAGRSTGVFNGKIVVRPDAQKTDSVQSNKNLLLSEHASINTKPQLEIFADDVRCTHGATVGQMEEEALFYLRSRGVGLDRARHLLMYAFAGDILDRMKVEPIRARLAEIVLAGPGNLP